MPSVFRQNPKTVEFNSPFQTFTNFQQASEPLTPATNFSDVTLAPATLRLDGCGRAYLTGKLLATGSVAAGDVVTTLPDYITLPRNVSLPVVVYAPTTGIASFNALEISAGGAPISSISITTPGSYTTIPTASVTGGDGFGAVLAAPRMKAVSGVIAAAGTNYAATNTITLTGGTSTTATILTVTNTKLVSVAVNAGGTGYQVNDTITLAGGTHSTAAVLTVASLGGSGAVATFTISNAGVYTVNSTTFTQASTSGSGTGATFNTGVFGVNVVSVSTPGSYSVLPSNPVAQGSTSGSGTGATFTMAWGVLSVAVTNGGEGYDSTASLVFSAGAAAGTLVLGAADTGVVTANLAITSGATVDLGGGVFFTNTYS